MLSTAEERISEIEGLAIEITQSEPYKEDWKGWNRASLNNGITSSSLICVVKVPEKERRDGGENMKDIRNCSYMSKYKDFGRDFSSLFRR